VERTALMRSLSNFEEWLAAKSPPEKTLLVCGFLKDVFGKQIQHQYIDFGVSNLKHFYLLKDFILQLSNEDLLKVYENEIELIEKAAAAKSVPGYIVRLLCRNFIDNLEGRSRAGIRPLSSKVCKSTKISELNARAELAYKQSDPLLPLTQKRISRAIINQIIQSPFIDLDLRLLFLRAEYPSGSKKPFTLLLEGYDERPYKGARTIKDSRVIEAYLFLAQKTGLKQKIIELDKQTLPVQDNFIYSIISEHFSITKQEIHRELRKLLDPRYSPASTKA
jgi:hypothetical protein